jgi:two-component system NtrC family sensor kinase
MSTSGPVVPPATDPRGRLLFVDDEPDMCEVMAEALAPFHEVVTTTDAHKALAFVAGGERFDVIFCDIGMPNMTGLEFHARLAVDNPAQASRVVLMSGGFTRRLGDAPPVLPRPLLEKPFGLQEVLSLVRESMRRDPLRVTPKIEAGRS